MAKSKYGLRYCAELKEPGSRDGDPIIRLNFYDESLPDTHIRFNFETDDYDKKFEFAEKLEHALNRIVNFI